ncbi:hypothetical protein SAY87_003889 [Trapa incisa]|uniref:Uncharacterized protein n=1 Tax=Trapa incisa TaxID=236973 RepID=A0AAN7PJ13_9MYRT|nr:hypothetical protein SAY87_003889 [Trapa incisa]
MHSQSCINLVGVISGDTLNYPQDGDTRGISPEDSSAPVPRVVLVAYFLPLNAHKESELGRWQFSLDEDSLLLQMKGGISSNSQVFFVGSLKVDIPEFEQEEVARELLQNFNCVPIFLAPDLRKNYYHGFCRKYLGPLFHYMLPMCGNQFDQTLWQAYISANKIYADKVLVVTNHENDYIWVHDYHLMAMPNILRRRFKRVKLGFFLHIPFPSSEIFRTLPVRNGILNALLNTDLIGFQTFDYARHFLSCCSRMLGLKYEPHRGYIGLDYCGRTVCIKVLPAGIHIGRLVSALNHPSSHTKAKEIREQLGGKKIILGVDDMDTSKGINLKLLAMERLLQQHPRMVGKVVLVQIINPTGKDVKQAKREICAVTERINETFGFPGYIPVILIDRLVNIYEKTAYYALAECCVVNAVRDGMNLIPYEYIVCRQGTAEMDGILEISSESSPRTSTIVVSEFIGCSPSLSGAIRVNPWDIEMVANALELALTMSRDERQARHEKHYKYVSTHDLTYWTNSFLQDLERACQDHHSKSCWGLGFGLGFRILSLPPALRKLSIEKVVSSYTRLTSSRVIFLDYDGTLVPQASIINTPSPKIISSLNCLCGDPGNTVFIVSGRGAFPLSECFHDCSDLGIAAEHGYLIRWNSGSEWEKTTLNEPLKWKEVAGPVMRLYTEMTDGSYVEAKESALVWHYRDADTDFGSFQAMELQDHLESILANEPVVVNKGKHIVEVKQQGISKGVVVETVISKLMDDGKLPEFVLCIGDDRSDEDMIESILDVASNWSTDDALEVFACTVGQKPSKAPYYLDDTVEVEALLESLASVTTQKGHGILHFFYWRKE